MAGLCQAELDNLCVGGFGPEADHQGEDAPEAFSNARSPSKRRQGRVPCAGASTGFSQAQLDQLCVNGCGDEAEGEDAPELFSNGLCLSKRRRAKSCAGVSTGVSQTDLDQLGVVGCDSEPRGEDAPGNGLYPSKRQHARPCAGSSPGVSQAELDQLCVVGCADELEGEDASEQVTSSLYMSKRRRRISFTGMGAEISALLEDEQEEMIDNPHGGLTQASLDCLMVAEEPSQDQRADSPIGDNLRRKKRSRVSVHGAGAQNMLVVASETLEESLLMVASPRLGFGHSPTDAPAKSPCKQRGGQRKENSGVSPNSPASKPMDKMSPASPPPQVQRVTPISPLQPINDLA